MTTFVTADTHFFHKNILKYQPDERPFADIEEMNETIIDNWNSMVNKNDLVYHLGDVGFASTAKLIPLIERLNGRIFLVIGNHDGGGARSARVKHLFEWQKDYYALKYKGEYIVMFHYPIHSWNRQHYGSFHFYGHTHGSIPYTVKGYSMDVGMDTNNCFPYNLDDLLDYLKSIQEAPTDPRQREELR